MQFKFFIENMTEMKKYLFQQLLVCCSERQRLSNDLSATSIQNAVNNGKIEALRAALLNIRVDEKEINYVDDLLGPKKVQSVPAVQETYSDFDDVDDIEFLQNQLSTSLESAQTGGLQDAGDEYYAPEYTENGRNIWV